MEHLVRTGKYDKLQLQDTISDATAGGVYENSICTKLCKSLVDRWVLVSNEAIARGVLFMIIHHRQVIETASALPIAAFLSVAEDYKDKKVALVITGSNIGSEKIKYILQNYSQHTF
ncbi:L-threonine ammonia-lyase-like [Saccoglossus kowalevskii]